MSFKKEIILGTYYVAIAKYSGVILSILITSILARLLKPSEFGVLAIASVIISFINMFTDMGIAPAIIQRDDLEKSDYNSLFSLTFYVGLLGALILLFVAQPLSSFFSDNDGITHIIRLMSVNVLLVSLNIVPNALLFKNKQFKLLAIRNVSTQFLAGAIAIILAYKGMGVYSLALQSILSALMIFSYNYFQHPLRFRYKLDLSPVKKIFSYSIYQMLSSIVSYISRNLDKIMVGKYINMSQLGFYEKSFRLISMPVDNISYVITPVMQPLFKDYQNQLQLMYEKYIKLVKIVVYIGFPLAGFLYINAYDLIFLFYGSQWVEAVPVFKMLSLAVPFTIMLATTSPIYQAANKTKLMFVVCIEEGIVSLLSLAVGLYIGGIANVAMCIAIGTFVRFLLTFSILHIWVFNVKPTLLFKNAFMSFILGCIISSMFYIVTHFFENIYIKLGLNIVILGFWLIIFFYKLNIFKYGRTEK